VKKVFFFIFFGISLLFSCQTKEHNAIEGFWTIDVIHFNQYDITRCLLVNVVSFESDVCELATTGKCDDLTEYEKLGTWSVFKTDSVTLVLRINTKNEIFRGDQRVIFHRDVEKRMLIMELVSDRLYVVCRKGLFDYDNNSTLIDELLKETNPSNAHL